MSVHATAHDGDETASAGAIPDDEAARPDPPADRSTHASPPEVAQLLASSFVADAPLAIYVVDTAGRVQLWNERAGRLLQQSASEAVLASDRDGPSPFIPDIDTSAHGELDTVTIDLVDDDGRPIGSLVMIADPSEPSATAELVRVTERKWRAVASRVADVISVTDADGRNFRRLADGGIDVDMGLGPGPWNARNILPEIHPDDIERAVAAFRRVRAVPGRREQLVVRTRHVDGHYEQLALTEVNLLDDPAFGFIAFAVNRVSDQLHNERLVADEAHVLELIACDTPLDDVLPAIVQMLEYHSGSTAAVLLLDDEGDLVMRAAPSVPDRLMRLIDTREMPVVVGPDRSFPRLREASEIVDIEAILGLVDDGAPAEWLHEIVDTGYRSVWTHPIIDRRIDDIFGILVLLVDQPRAPTRYERAACEVAGRLTAIAIERAQWQHQLWRQARFDPLTSLPNRTHIFEQLDRLLADARVARQPITTMVLDLDRFMVINDSLGHAAGDELLVGFAQRLTDTVGSAALIGRIAADEFVVAFAAGVRLREAKLTAGRIADALDQPFHVGDDDVFLTVSIGIASSLQGQENADTLLQRADAAMFRAKALGRDRAEVYDDRLRSRAVRRLEVDRELRVALERGELQLYYQPEIDCRTGRIVGAEALLRWQHPTRGLIHPDGFINVAEESGIIVPIGHWVLDEAVRQARTWSDSHPSANPFMVSVNLSARQLINRSLVDTVAFALTRYNWPPSQLTLELTESILIEDRDATLYVLNRLRLLGVKLAIDDFGTGFASLDYLHRLHVDWIKIDRSFVKMLDADGNGSPVATAMMHMARDFDLLVTAEGVEEQRQFDGLKRIGCDLAQGFLFARPLPSDEFERLLMTGRSW